MTIDHGQSAVVATLQIHFTSTGYNSLTRDRLGNMEMKAFGARSLEICVNVLDVNDWGSYGNDPFILHSLALYPYRAELRFVTWSKAFWMGCL